MIANVNNAKTLAVPPSYLLKCHGAPIIYGSEISDVKRAYLETQSELIGVCMRHDFLSDWVLDQIGGDK